MKKTAEALRLAGVAKTKLKELSLALSRVKEKGTIEETQSNVLDLLLLMADLENRLQIIVSGEDEPQSENDMQIDRSNPTSSMTREIEKVRRRLRKWAESPQQINTRILKLFIDLESSGEVKITESLLMERYKDHSEFLNNFNQMKMISSKNHGKVFDVIDGHVTIWEPVREAVIQFQKTICGGSCQPLLPLVNDTKEKQGDPAAVDDVTAN